MMYNPVEVKIRLKKVEFKKPDPDGNKYYYIGNCDMDISLLDTVLKFFPPQDDDQRSGMLVINNTKERYRDDDDTKS